MNRLARFFLVLSLVFLLPAFWRNAPVGAQVIEQREGLGFFDTGPLRVRDQFLLGMGFLAFDPTGADVLDGGHWKLDAILSGTNTWVQTKSVEEALEERDGPMPITLEELRGIESGGGDKGIYHADGELYRLDVTARRGIGHGLQLSLSIPVLNFQGGFGDAMIQDFHDAFGIDQGGRLGILQDSYTVYIRDRNGNELFEQSDPGTDLGDITLGIKGRIPVPSERWRLAVEGLVKLPTGDEDKLYSSGSEDLGLQVLLTRYFSRSCIHASVGIVRLGDAERFHLDSQTRLAGLVAYEHALSRTISLVTQVTTSQSPFKELDIDGLDDVAFLIDFGFKKGIAPHTVLFAAFSENFINFGNAADFGLHVGVTRTF